MGELRDYARRALEKGARAVILIGSLARGDHTAFSDADVVVVADDVPRRCMDRSPRFMDPSLSVDLEPRVYTTGELLAMARRGAGVVGEIVRHGVLLAGDSRLLEEIKAAYKPRINGARAGIRTRDPRLHRPVC